VDIRGRFIIDPDFVLRTMEGLTREASRYESELIRQVKAFQLVVKIGEVSPSSWQAGKSTLKPVSDHAGKAWKVWKPESAFD
jgi:alkyl hydroperoxide reductase subunit AhpC